MRQPLPGQQNAAQVVDGASGFVRCPAGTTMVRVGGDGGLTDSGPHYLQSTMAFGDLTGSTAVMTGRPPSGRMVIQATCAN